jgi:hypothetical protein
MIIKFTDTRGIPEEYEPQPASFFIPEWYKKIESYMNGSKKPTGDGGTTGTIKRCMPVFDAIVGGYIIVTPSDVYVTQKEMEDGSIEPYFEWSNFGMISFHPVEQAPNHPNRNNHTAYPKWINPWAIKTPKGYSTLFVQPMHRESVFTILPGVVDTDIYTAPVNFPFVLNDVKFEGLIPAGTPIAQVIPFKRDSWEMSKGTIEDFNEQLKVTNRLKTKIFDGYKSIFRQPKEYK